MTVLTSTDPNGGLKLDCDLANLMFDLTEVSVLGRAVAASYSSVYNSLTLWTLNMIDVLLVRRLDLFLLSCYSTSALLPAASLVGTVTFSGLRLRPRSKSCTVFQNVVRPDSNLR